MREKPISGAVNNPRSRERRAGAESPVPPSSAENTAKPPNDDDLDDLKVDSTCFRADLNRRMGILNGDKAKEARDKRDQRRFVLEECLKRGLDLWSNFSTYPYETKMYPTIKWITTIAPPAWGWDRVIIRDIIRTLCWDRVRSMNRRYKASNPEEAEKEAEKKAKKEAKKSRATKQKLMKANSKPMRQTSDISDISEGEVQPPPKVRPHNTKERLKPTRRTSDISDGEVQPPPKERQRTAGARAKLLREVDEGAGPLPRKYQYRTETTLDEAVRFPKAQQTFSRTRIPDVHTQNASSQRLQPTSPAIPPSSSFRTMSSSSEELYDAQRLPHLTYTPTPRNSFDEELTLRVRIGSKSYVFPRDIDWEEFDSAIDNVLTIQMGEIRVYRANSGTKRDKEWKPLCFMDELKSAVEKFSEVGIEVSVEKEVEKACFNSLN